MVTQSSNRFDALDTVKADEVSDTLIELGSILDRGSLLNLLDRANGCSADSSHCGWLGRVDQPRSNSPVRFRTRGGGQIAKSRV